MLRKRNAALQARIDRATEDLRERERLLATQAGALERMNAQLLELNEQKSRFLSIVAHDLRNPLTGILLSSQILQEQEDPVEIQRRAVLIAREGAHMESLIGRFLDLSALETGTIRTEPGEFSMARLAGDVAARYADAAARKNLRIVVDAEPDGGRVFADPKFVAAVIDNLLSNALKFSPSGKTVWLRVEDGPSEVRLSVQDEGPGLTEEDRKRLFGRFARLSAQPTGGESSIGLGLSIAKQMVEACGGLIQVESRPGAGATFIVVLPRALA
jgi:signal transduction histidine kinase